MMSEAQEPDKVPVETLQIDEDFSIPDDSQQEVIVTINAKVAMTMSVPTKGPFGDKSRYLTYTINTDDLRLAKKSLQDALRHVEHTLAAREIATQTSTSTNNPGLVQSVSYGE